MNTNTSKSETPSGSFVYSTAYGPMSATSRMGTGWTLSQWTPGTGTTYVGHFRTIDAVDAHIAANYTKGI